MATLGLFLLWSGYTVGIYGYAKIQNARITAPPLTFSDVALPSHRGLYLAAALFWTTPTPSSTSPGAANSAAQANIDAVSAAQTKAGKPQLSTLGTGVPAPGVVIPTPTPVPSGPFIPGIPHS